MADATTKPGSSDPAKEKKEPAPGTKIFATVQEGSEPVVLNDDGTVNLRILLVSSTGKQVSGNVFVNNHLVGHVTVIKDPVLKIYENLKVDKNNPVAIKVTQHDGSHTELSLPAPKKAKAKDKKPEVPKRLKVDVLSLTNDKWNPVVLTTKDPAFQLAKGTVKIITGQRSKLRFPDNSMEMKFKDFFPVETNDHGHKVVMIKLLVTDEVHVSFIHQESGEIVNQILLKDR